MEDASGGAAGLPQITQAGGGPARSAPACLDGVSVVGASVPSAARRGCPRRGATDDERVAAAPVSRVWTDRAPFPGGTRGLCHPFNVPTAAHPAATALHHARPDPCPPTTSATVRLAPPGDAALHRR